MSADRYAVLFEPVRIGPVTAPNRFYAVPHATGHGWNQPRGAIALRAMKAEGGWGTVATQMTEIAPDSDMGSHPMDRIWDDGDVPRHALQVDEVKKHGSLAAIELAHGGMRSRNLTTGHPVIGPSSLPILRPEIPGQSKAMDKADIAAFRNSHKAAATRAKLAGYDILYVYAAHDLSLLNHFLSPTLNSRHDEYGGSFQNRLRLLREVLEDTLEVAGGDCAVALRFSVAEPGKPDGVSHEGEGPDVVEALAELPDLWDVNISGWPNDSQTARFSEEGYQLPFTDFVKTITSKPVVGVGRFTSPDMMVSLVKKGRLDLIGAARPSIADPFLPAKIREGRVEDIRECIGCNVCVSMDAYGLPIRCTQNPTISEEFQRGWHPEAPALSQGRQSHLIVGSGPAGLECAVTLLKAGQKVTVADGRDVPGGRVAREAGLPGLSSWTRVLDYRLQQLNRSADADLFLSSCLTAEDIMEFDADTVTIATGASWRNDGVGSTNASPLFVAADGVYSPDDVMDGALVSESASDVIVYDDDNFYMASVIAEQLCKVGHRVTYATPQPMVATWTDFTLDQDRIVQRLQELKVEMLVNTKLRDRQQCADLLSDRRIAIDDMRLVIVGARLPQNQLYTELFENENIKSLHQGGDCVAPGTIQGAVLSGHAIARKILSSKDNQTALRREQLILNYE
ncbi:MAG: FAD-dependent oxidoreductase [Granulosicoccus sp.]|nr:FAD-dependent oxidoreductase [Granulosicoccus sp.]